MNDDHIKNILVLGVGIHLITRDQLIHAGFKITEIPVDDFYLNLDVRNDVEFNLNEIDFGEKTARAVECIMMAGSVEQCIDMRDLPQKPIIPQEQSWQQMNKGKYGKKQRRGKL